ncbi:hypothetical protein BV25DRAFT_951353 [Artomyces pyxidatus]|uniref:Uncharacterized protein n=1 Tax=Artomyces pyxidatus TaxID=48021 RepID=A0ACB8SV88_9AGAM|nr:hypothetical protein BV25DRAFT_951353 [Artomyces pyxidatus]
MRSGNKYIKPRGFGKIPSPRRWRFTYFVSTVELTATFFLSLGVLGMIASGMASIATPMRFHQRKLAHGIVIDVTEPPATALTH